MSRKSVPADKNPLHPSALRLKDLTPGRTIIVFDKRYGETDTYVVLGYPTVMSIGMFIGSDIVVRLRSVNHGYVATQYCADLGVIKYKAHGWDLIFSVDHRKQHLLPGDDELVPFDDNFDDLGDDLSYWHDSLDESLVDDHLDDHDDSDDFDGHDFDEELHAHVDDLLIGNPRYVKGTDEQLAALRAKLSGSI